MKAFISASECPVSNMNNQQHENNRFPQRWSSAENIRKCPNTVYLYIVKYNSCKYKIIVYIIVTKIFWWANSNHWIVLWNVNKVQSNIYSILTSIWRCFLRFSTTSQKPHIEQKREIKMYLKTKFATIINERMTYL